MAEALSVASSAIAVVDLSAKVFSLCLQYSREVKNAKDDIEKLRGAVATFQTTAKELRTLVEGPRGKGLKASQQLTSAIEDGRLRLEELEKQLEPLTDASFDSKAEEYNPTCLPDTRQELLKEIDRWIYNPEGATSAVAFFFRRGEMDRGNLNKLMLTLAYQLALSIPRVAFFVKKILDAIPNIIGKSVKEQFEKLIQELLFEAAATATASSSVVMVIDVLDECDQEADYDIIVFLNDEFEKIRYDFNITMAVPLFIFAATQTYAPILHSQIVNLPKEEREEVIKDFKVVVSSIVTLANPLSVAALSKLIDILSDTVDERLDALHSLLHLSFRDYLVDFKNKERIEFWVDTKLAHQRLAEHCLRIIRSGLRKNICSLSFPGMQQSSVNVQLLEERIPSELQYACMYWVHHQTEVSLQPNDMGAMYDFLETHFLYWLEVLSLIGRMGESIELLEELQSIVDVGKGGRVVSFLHDAKRFVLNCCWVVDTAPLQLYASSIVFAPKQSIVRQTFKRYLPEWISLLPKVDSEWNAVL
ncbi:hypothetical protein EDB82DRAFT_567457 [Fusarium venenatum]|uniref:uncharacterized protein n=1 Tax=Fusarium venenatum TaxID=56646 RepID=UPI001D656A53|nr:hypothetical protein EDB82DRAFT_567457 [Fusarium venenatum]